MSMTLTELMEQLEYIAVEHPDLRDEPINVAFQQSYPLAGLIVNATVLDHGHENADEEASAEVWLALSDNRREPYASSLAWTEELS